MRFAYFVSYQNKQGQYIEEEFTGEKSALRRSRTLEKMGMQEVQVWQREVLRSL